MIGRYASYLYVSQLRATGRQTRTRLAAYASAMAHSLSPRMRAAIVYNPGKVPLERLRERVAAAQERYGWDASSWHETSRDDEGRAAAEAALEAHPAVVVAAGGDGTVRAVAEVLRESEVPLALLPSGTGNLLARNLGLPLTDLDASLDTAFGGTIREVDVAIAELEHADGRLSRRAFMVMAGIGLDAEMAENTSAIAKRRLGWFAYVTPIARSVIANRLFALHYRVGSGRTRSVRAHTVIVGNCGTLTGNMLLLPTAVVDDGLLDMVVLRPKGPFSWARIGTRLTVQGIAHRSRIGRRMLHLAPDLEALTYARDRGFDIRFDAPQVAELDGDSFGPIRSARIAVQAGALRVCTLHARVASRNVRLLS
jgi:diacylglycerol kinase family enzyme